MTLTLVVVSVTFILLCLPFSLYLILTDFVLKEMPNESPFVFSLRYFMYALVNVLWYCNSAVNFYLYCLTGSKFRTECLRMLTLIRFPRNKQDAANNSRSTEISDANSTNGNNAFYENHDF